MTSVGGKSALGRQTQLPLKRAFIISMNSLKIRFGRSIITAGGIFLGIAFLATVLTQQLMQWPVPEKIGAGYVKIDGEINGPGEIEVWKPISVEEGLAAGLPADVVARVADDAEEFSLTDVAQGTIDVERADKNLARYKSEWAALREVPKSLYSEENADKEITLKDARNAGVPETVAKKLAGDGKSFKGSVLAEAIKGRPGLIDRSESRAQDLALFKTVDRKSVDKLSGQYAMTVNEALEIAKRPTDDADVGNVMVVNTGRKVRINFTEDGESAGNVKLRDGDNIYVPDRNSRYRMYWLVVMSLLVCTVGITNSMLMSVTERFKEIGTMKCLGALDSFVVILFMLESGMMGIVASIVGWAVGFGAIVLLAGSTRGWDVVGNMEFTSVLYSFLISVGAGLVLTITATIAPAKRAADMPAAMALRSEI